MPDRLAKTAPAPLVSIIAPVYGVEAFIADCLDSIIGATGFADICELIIVDDGSIDGSMAIAQGRCRDLANVTIIKQANAGLGAARNAGLKRARGRYVWFVDSDDEICRDALTILADCIERHAPDIVAFEFETIGQTLDRPAYLPVFDRPVAPVDFLRSGRPPSCAPYYLFSKGLLEGCGHTFQPGIYHEDALFTPLALVQAHTIVRIFTACYRYRMREGSIMSGGRSAKHLRDMAFVVRELARRSKEFDRKDSRWRALAREIGFSLGGLQYYWSKSAPMERRGVIGAWELMAIGTPRFWHFSARSNIKYIILLLYSINLSIGTLK